MSQRGIRNLPGGEGRAHWDRMCLDRGLSKVESKKRIFIRQNPKES